LHVLTQITEGTFSFSAASEEQLDNLLEITAEKSFLFALYRKEVFLKETVKIVLPIIEKVEDFSIIFILKGGGLGEGFLLLSSFISSKMPVVPT